MKKIKGKYGTAYIDNCLNAEGKWDLLFTDTLWGVGYDGKNPSGINRKAYKPDVINYPDIWDPIFMEKWFTKFQKLTEAQVVCTGWKYFNWWVDKFDPIGYHFIVFNNGQGMGKTAKHQSTSPYLCFGDPEWWKKHKFFRSHSNAYITNGFLRKHKYVNPSPKDYSTWAKMIADLNPSSIVDPFLGSGTLGEVGESLGIPWNGYEIMEEYKIDIKKRVAKGMFRHNQEKLFPESD